MSLAAIEPRPIEWRPWLVTESRVPRQKKVMEDDRRPEDRDPASDKSRGFGMEGSSSSGIALTSSELKEYLFEEVTERRFNDLEVLNDPPIEPSDIDVGIVDASECAECLRWSKRKEMGVAGPRLSIMLEVSLDASPLSSIDGIAVSNRNGRGKDEGEGCAWAATAGGVHSSGSSSEPSSKVLINICIPMLSAV